MSLIILLLILLILGIFEQINTRQEISKNATKSKENIERFNSTMDELKKLQEKDYLGDVCKDEVLYATIHLNVTFSPPNRYSISWSHCQISDHLKKGYEIYRNYSDKASKKIATVPFNSRNYSYEYIDIVNEKDTRPISYSVYLFCKYENTIYRSTHCVGGHIKLLEPQLKAKPLDSNTIRLYWNYKHVVKKYEIYRKESYEYFFSLIATLPNESHRYTDRTIMPNTEYVYQLKAIILEENSEITLESPQLVISLPVSQVSSNIKKDSIQDKNIDFDSMNGHEFEAFCAELLKKNGFRNVTKTKGSGDQGIDILAKKGNVSYGIQCKCYSSKVGNKAVQEVFSGKAYYNLQIGVVLTNNYFTPSAINLAEKNGILLWNRQKLISLITQE